MNNLPLSAATRPTLKDGGLDFKRFAYFTRPLKTTLSSRPPEGEELEWMRFEDLIGRLKSGDFFAARDVLRLCRETTDWSLKFAGTRVLGHAGTVECFKEMRAELEQHPMRKQERVDVPSRELVRSYCQAFALWKRLDAVPVLMDQYLTLRLGKTPEIAMLPIWMADLLVDEEGSMMAHEPPEDMLEDYLNLVMNRYDSLVSRLGSGKVFVFRGELYSVRAIAERMRHLTTRFRDMELAGLREHFEPATGIDCSAIFAGESASPLVAASIAEAFLDSEEGRKFEPGKRYFFGHLIPE